MGRRPALTGALLALALVAPAVAPVERPSSTAPPARPIVRLDANLLDDPIEVAGPTLATSSALGAMLPPDGDGDGDDDGAAGRPAGGASHRVSH